jgi:hypothetical protein
VTLILERGKPESQQELAIDAHRELESHSSNVEQIISIHVGIVVDMD